jgi:phospholipid:diacylglycerol acyltransferase
MQGEYEQDESRSDAEDSEAFVRGLSDCCTVPDLYAQCDASDPTNECDNATTFRSPLDFPLARRNWIDAEVTVKGSIPEVSAADNQGHRNGFSETNLRRSALESNLAMETAPFP